VDVARRPDFKRLALSVGIAAGLALIIVGLLSARTGRDASNFPVAIERMSPADGDRVLRQSQIVVDFIEGYEAELTIDGILLPTTRLDELTSSGRAPTPGAQVELPPTAVYDPGNFIISYQPQPGAPIEAFSQGEHEASVRYWRTEDGPAKSRSYMWRFITD
jgi:hypothetical protein